MLRLLRNEALILPAEYQRERRKLAQRRKAAFAKDPIGPNQVWQLDFSEFETTTGGTWRLAGCRDYWSEYEHPFHVWPTANQPDAIDAIELALTDYQRMFGHPMIEDCPVDPDTGELLPVVTIVTDNLATSSSRMLSIVPRRAMLSPLIRPIAASRPSPVVTHGLRKITRRKSGCRRFD